MAIAAPAATWTVLEQESPHPHREELGIHVWRCFAKSVSSQGGVLHRASRTALRCAADSIVERLPPRLSFRGRSGFRANYGRLLTLRRWPLAIRRLLVGNVRPRCSVDESFAAPQLDALKAF